MHETVSMGGRASSCVPGVVFLLCSNIMYVYTRDAARMCALSNCPVVCLSRGVRGYCVSSVCGPCDNAKL